MNNQIGTDKLNQSNVESDVRCYVKPLALLPLVIAMQACIHDSNGGSKPAATTPAAVTACSETTTAAHNACQFEVDDDYWIAIGNCKNLSDEAESTECLADADVDRGDALAECAEFMTARADICAAIGEDPYDPEIDPAQFLDAAAIAASPNPYFPLVPGTVWTYEFEEETIVVTVTDETKEILGVTTIVVNDVVMVDGEVVEDTDDWYAQDLDGNVWYMGEISLNYEDGELVDIEGSWKSGVEGAKPGILMFASPVVGTVYRQEFFLGDAEDMGEVLSVTGTESVPAGACAGDCVITRDFLPLEPDANEHKYYAPGIGMILEIDVESGDRVELIDLVTP